MDRWDANGRQGGIRAVIDGVVRIPTGLPRDPYDPLSLGTTSGQADVGLGLAADLGTGAFGARIRASYLVQLAATVEHRLTPVAMPVDPSAPIASLNWNPGDVLQLGLRPFVRLAPGLAIQIGVDYLRHGRDSYAYASQADAIPGLDPTLREAGTERDAWVVGGGITYSTPSAADPRATGLPVEAYWTYEGVAASSKGVVPKSRGVRFGARLYFRLWGR